MIKPCRSRLLSAFATCWLVAVSSFSANAQTTAPHEALGDSGFSIRQNGVIDLGNVYIEINHYDSKWVIAQQHDKFTRTPTTAPSDFQGAQIEGILATARGPAQIVERVQNTADGIHYAATFASDTPIESHELGLAVILPVVSFGGKQMKVDGDSVELPQAPAAKGAAVLYTKPSVHELSLLTPRGQLTFTGNFGVKLNDDREWNDPRFSLRLLFTPPDGSIKTSMIELQLKLDSAAK